MVARLTHRFNKTILVVMFSYMIELILECSIVYYTVFRFSLIFFVWLWRNHTQITQESFLVFQIRSTADLIPKVENQTRTHRKPRVYDKNHTKTDRRSPATVVPSTFTLCQIFPHYLHSHAEAAQREQQLTLQTPPISSKLPLPDVNSHLYNFYQVAGRKI